jgi:hypothetical protein
VATEMRKPARVAGQEKSKSDHIDIMAGLAWLCHPTCLTSWPRRCPAWHSAAAGRARNRGWGRSGNGGGHWAPGTRDLRGGSLHILGGLHKVRDALLVLAGRYR